LARSIFIDPHKDGKTIRLLAGHERNVHPVQGGTIDLRRRDIMLVLLVVNIRSGED
jgi:hypothetical protein